MKKYLYSIVIACIAVVSCTKEVPEDEQANGKDSQEFIIRGFCDDELTKTTYTLAGDEYEFSWLNLDKVAVQTIKKDDGSYDASVFTNSATDGPVATFGASGTGSHDLGDYAFYPCRFPYDSSTPSFSYDGKWIYYGQSETDLSYLKTGNAVADQEAAEAASKARVRLFETITEDASYPMRHIPLIGIRKENTNDYYFKAATGVLKLNFKDLPASTTQIRLSATGYALNGYFVFDTYGEIKESYKKEGWNIKYMNIETNGNESRDFFFPIPTGTIPAGTLTISLYDGSNTIYSVKNTEDIVLVRGEVTELPAITVPEVVIKFTGTHQATVYFSGDVKKVSWTTAQNSVYTSRANQINYVTTSGTVINLGDGYPDSGIRYFGYSAYNDADATKDSEASKVVVSKMGIEYYNPSLVASVIGTYNWIGGDVDLSTYAGTQHSSINPHSSFGKSLPSSPSITFAASDNISKGNIMITSFCGKETRKVYGFYKNATTDVTFSADQTIFIENGNRYHIRESNNAYVRFRIGTDLSVYGTYSDLYCQGENMYLYHGPAETWAADANWDYNIRFFLANRPRDIYNVAGAVNDGSSSGQEDVVFGTSWDPSVSANNLVYDPTTHLYTKDLSFPKSVSKVSFKIVKDNNWAESSWPTDNNYDISINSNYSGTLTISFNASSGEITHSITYYSGYVLNVKQEELAAATNTKWGTNRYASSGDYHFIQIADEDGYKRFLIPEAIVDNTGRNLSFAGDNGCEVKRTFTPSSEQVNYYFKTDGFEFIDETGTYTTEKRVWVQSNIWDSLGQWIYAHMWENGNGSNTTDWNNCVMTESSAKYDWKKWYYSPIGTGRNRLIISAGTESERQYNKAEFEIDPSKNQYFYMTHDGSYHHGQLFITPWIENN